MNCLATLAVTTMWLKSQINVEARAKAKKRNSWQATKEGAFEKIKYYRVQKRQDTCTCSFNSGMFSLQLGTTSIPKCLSKWSAAYHEMTMWNDSTPEDGQTPLLGIIGRSLGSLGNVIDQNGSICVSGALDGSTRGMTRDITYNWKLPISIVWVICGVGVGLKLFLKKRGPKILSLKRSERLRDYGL